MGTTTGCGSLVNLGKYVLGADKKILDTRGTSLSKMVLEKDPKLVIQAWTVVTGDVHLKAGSSILGMQGDLTIKGKTNPVTFDLSVYGNKATANVKIDRTKFDVKYGSTSFFDDLKDKAIYDEFDLVTDLEF